MNRSFVHRLGGREWKRPESCADSPVLLLGIGLIPASAAAITTVNGAFIGMTTLIVMLFTMIAVSALRRSIPSAILIPFILIIAAASTSAITALLIHYTPEISTSLGIYLPLTAVNGMILIRSSRFATQNTVGKSAADALSLGSLGLLILTLTGAIRETLGTDGLLPISRFSHGDPLRFMSTTPAGLICIAFSIALIRYLRSRRPGGGQS